MASAMRAVAPTTPTVCCDSPARGPGRLHRDSSFDATHAAILPTRASPNRRPHSLSFGLRLQAPELKSLGFDRFFDALAREPIGRRGAGRHRADRVPWLKFFRQPASSNVTDESAQ